MEFLFVAFSKEVLEEKLTVEDDRIKEIQNKRLTLRFDFM